MPSETQCDPVLLLVVAVGAPFAYDSTRLCCDISSWVRCSPKIGIEVYTLCY